jgi:hypothetical protein
VARYHGVRRLDGGGVRVRLSHREREALRSLPGQLRPLLTGEQDVDTPQGPLRDRLFPRGYDDPLAEMEYRELVGSSLVDERVAALDEFARTLESGDDKRLWWTLELDADEAAAWLSAVNDARLTLGMLLGIESEGQWEGGPDPEDPTSVMMFYLGWLEEELVHALMGGLGGDAGAGPAAAGQ